jgi:hypothetical protein
MRVLASRAREKASRSPSDAACRHNAQISPASKRRQPPLSRGARSARKDLERGRRRRTAAADCHSSTSTFPGLPHGHPALRGRADILSPRLSPRGPRRKDHRAWFDPRAACRRRFAASEPSPPCVGLAWRRRGAYQGWERSGLQRLADRAGGRRRRQPRFGDNRLNH